MLLLLLLLQVLSVRRNVLNGSAQGVEWCHNLVHLDLSVSAAAATAAAAAPPGEHVQLVYL
jgi:hypothetical protein